MNRHEITLEVNGESRELSVPARHHLADALREDLGLTGTHLGCEQGVCGACTVMIDCAPQRACLNLAVSCGSARIRTIEGFADDPLMQTLRANFSAYHALQCGYCTPGMLITAHDIVRRLPHADEARIRHELAGNLCRCTGYAGIVEAIIQTLREFTPDHPWRHAACAPIPQTAIKAAERIEVAPIRPQAAMATTSLGDGITREIEIHLPATELWEMLSDVETIANCLPGFTLASSERLADGRDQLRGQMTVALGPIKTRFEGEADVAFDHPVMTGRVSGRGEDHRSRSAGTGVIAFAVQPAGSGCTLDVTVDYDVTGPLAQFSRSGLVADLVSTLLDQFAGNIQARAAGEQIEAAHEIAAGNLGANLLGQRLQALKIWLSSLWRRP